MNKSQFYKRLKYIYNHTKRDPDDSSLENLSNQLMNDVVSRSNGGWDESIAAEHMRFVELMFGVQPEATQNAKQVTSKDVETELERFLAKRGYSYRHIPESNEQTPDGYIEGFGYKYLCELKLPVLQFDHNAALFGYKFSTTHSKILDAIRKAKKQLEKLDPEHALLHTLIYTSAHPQLNWSGFVNAVRGYAVRQDGITTTDLRSTDIFKNTDQIIEDIDLYIWCQVGADKKFYQISYFINQSSTHAQSVKDLVSRLQSRSLSPMDNSMSIQEIR